MNKQRSREEILGYRHGACLLDSSKSEKEETRERLSIFWPRRLQFIENGTGPVVNPSLIRRRIRMPPFRRGPHSFV